MTILHSRLVEQTVDRDERGRFVKELVLTRVRHGKDPVPLAMVRKRSAARNGTVAAVILIHGYGQNRYAWHLPSRSFSNYMARAGFDVFNLELRGHGRSRHLGAKRPASVADFVREDVPAAIDEVLRLSGHDRAFLIGHSLGGLVSYAASTLVPALIAGTVSLGSPYHFTRGSWTLRLIGDAMLAFDRRVPLGQGAFGLKPVGEALRVARVVLESVPVPIRGFAPRSMERQILAQHMSLAMDQGSVAVLRNMFLAAAESRRTGHLEGGLAGYTGPFEALDLPLLVIAGAQDDLAPPASVHPAYERSRARDKTYRVFPRGHIDLLVGRDSPVSVWPTIEAWIRGRLRSREAA